MTIIPMTYEQLFDMVPALAKQRARFLCNAARIRAERDRLPVVDFADEIQSLEALNTIINGDVTTAAMTVSEFAQLVADVQAGLSADPFAEPADEAEQQAAECEAVADKFGLALTPEQTDVLEWQRETMDTRASDYPM